MAIFHLNVSIIGRKKGRSVVAAAAYRSGEKLTDHRTGIVHDYTRKRGVDDSVILAPPQAPSWVSERSALWNEIERVEKRHDAQLAREIDLALPVELSHDSKRSLLCDFIQTECVDQGMIADICFHELNSNNPHAHILLSMRVLTPAGFGNKNRDWNQSDFLQHLRAEWSETVNQFLADAGHDSRIDHRSYEAQGIERVPQIHLGPKVVEMELRGIQTDRGEKGRRIDATNERIEALTIVREETETAIQLEQERLELERLERARIERKRIEIEKRFEQRKEQERIERERLERERKEQQRKERERIERERTEKSRIERERKERMSQDAYLSPVPAISQSAATSGGLSLTLLSAHNLNADQWMQLTPRQQSNLALEVKTHQLTEPSAYTRVEQWVGQEAYLKKRLKELSTCYATENKTLETLENRGKRSSFNWLGATSEQLDNARVQLKATHKVWKKTQKDFDDLQALKEKRQQELASLKEWNSLPNTKAAQHVTSLMQQPSVRERYELVKQTVEAFQQWHDFAKQSSASATSIDSIEQAKQLYLDGHGLSNTVGQQMQRDLAMAKEIERQRTRQHGFER